MDRIVVEYLANALWQVPLLVTGVAALLWALGAGMRTRHHVWLAVLAIAVLLPLRGMSGGEAGVPAPRHLSAAAPAADADHVLAAEPLRRHGLVIGAEATRWLVRLHGAVLAFAAWRILRSWIAARQLVRRSRSIDLAPRAMAIFAQAAHRRNIALPRLRQSDRTISPVVIGARRPVLLLPAGFDRLKDDEIQAALSHEFAHLARRDYLVNIVCQIVALPLAWHPAIHYVHKRIRDTREILCDAAAAEEMASPVRYATCLVAFALRALDGRDAAPATQGLSMFDNRILEERMLHLTQAPEQPEPSTRLARLTGAAIGLVMAVTMALLFHITPTWAEGPVQLAPPSPPASADMKRAIEEESRQRAAQHQRDLDQSKRDQKQARLDDEQRKRDLQQALRDQEEARRDAAQAQREAEREAAETQREAAQARREAIHEAERQTADARRMAAELKRQVADAGWGPGPEFQTQMADLRVHMQELHDSMAELGRKMKDLDRQVSRDGK